MDKELEQKVQELIDHLMGSCETMPYWVQDHPEETAICEMIDYQIFLCGTCGWWCEDGDWAETDDTTADVMCSDCGEIEHG